MNTRPCGCERGREGETVGEGERKGMTEGRAGMQDVKYSRDKDEDDACQCRGTNAGLPVGVGQS